VKIATRPVDYEACAPNTNDPFLAIPITTCPAIVLVVLLNT